jgi:hypothetical protein
VGSLIISRVCEDFADVVGDAGLSDAEHRERVVLASYSYRSRISNESSQVSGCLADIPSRDFAADFCPLLIPV